MSYQRTLLLCLVLSLLLLSSFPLWSLEVSQNDLAQLEQALNDSKTALTELKNYSEKLENQVIDLKQELTISKQLHEQLEIELSKQIKESQTLSTYLEGYRAEMITKIVLATVTSFTIGFFLGNL